MGAASQRTLVMWARGKRAAACGVAVPASCPPAGELAPASSPARPQLAGAAGSGRIDRLGPHWPGTEDGHAPSVAWTMRPASAPRGGVLGVCRGPHPPPPTHTPQAAGRRGRGLSCRRLPPPRPFCAALARPAAITSPCSALRWVWRGGARAAR